MGIPHSTPTLFPHTHCDLLQEQIRQKKERDGRAKADVLAAQARVGEAEGEGGCGTCAATT